MKGLLWSAAVTTAAFVFPATTKLMQGSTTETTATTTTSTPSPPLTTSPLLGRSQTTISSFPFTAASFVTSLHANNNNGYGSSKTNRKGKKKKNMRRAVRNKKGSPSTTSSTATATATASDAAKDLAQQLERNLAVSHLDWTRSMAEEEGKTNSNEMVTAKDDGAAILERKAQALKDHQKGKPLAQERSTGVSGKEDTRETCALLQAEANFRAEEGATILANKAQELRDYQKGKPQAPAPSSSTTTVDLEAAKLARASQAEALALHTRQTQALIQAELDARVDEGAQALADKVRALHNHQDELLALATARAKADADALYASQTKAAQTDAVHDQLLQEAQAELDATKAAQRASAQAQADALALRVAQVQALAKAQVEARAKEDALAVAARAQSEARVLKELAKREARLERLAERARLREATAATAAGDTAMTSMIPASDNSSPSPLAVGAGVWALVTGNGNPDEALVSYELKDGASQEAAKGAALAALVLSTMAGHDVQSTATMTFVAVYLSVTRGLAGDLTRAVGEWSSNMVAHVRETTDLSPAAVWTATSNAWTDSRQWFRARQAAHDAAVRRMRDVRKSRQTEAQWDRYVQDVRQEFFVATPEQMEQLRLKEEEKERIRKAAEAERLRIAAEQERLRLEAEAEAERVRLEAEAERERIAKAERNERLRIAGEAKKEQIRLREEAKAERRRVKAERERIRMAAKQEKTRLAAERAKLKSKFEIEQRRVLEIQRKEEDNDLILAQAEHKKKIMAEANQQIRQETDYESQRLEAEKAQILRAGAPFSNEQRRLREIQELQAEKAHIMAMAEEKSLRLELENERIRMAAKEKQRRLADEKERLLQLKTLSTLGNIMESMEYQENVLESRMGEGIGEDSDGLGSTTFRKQKRIQSHAEATSRSLLEARLRFERTRKKYGTARAVSGVGRTRFRTEEGSPVLSRKRDQTRKGPHDKTTDTD